jgi:peptide/nickel transport system substrate-binding protein
MLNRVGIAAKVETLPKAIYFTRMAKFETMFSFALSGTLSLSGDNYSLLRNLYATMNPGQSLGPQNYGHYSNPKLDAIVAEIAVTMDDAKREKLLHQGSRIVIRDDVATIPLFHTVEAWATAKDVEIRPRSDGLTLATDVRKAN